MKHVLVSSFLFALLWLVGCRQKDVQPTTGNEFAEVPTAVVQAVKQAYPTAANLTFTELDKGNVWESAFSVQKVNHEAKVDVKGTILEAYALAATGGVATPQSATLPAAAKAYIEKNYATYKIIAIGEGQYNNQKAYKVALRSEKEEVTLIFDGNGALVLEFKTAVVAAPSSTTKTAEAPKTYPITKTDDLPAAAVQYLTANGLTLSKGLASIGKDNLKTYYVVAIKGTTIYELTFDNDGKLLKSSSMTPSTTPTNSKVELKSINDLPAAAIAYLAGYTFQKGTSVTSNGQTVYIVLATKDGKQYQITFDANGKVVASVSVPKIEEKAITSDKDLPAAILNYLNTTYKSWVFMKAVAVVIDGKTASYTVVIKASETIYYVVFTGEGKFEAVKKG